MPSNKIKIGNRIREFAMLKFGAIAPLAQALDMKPQSLYTYLNGDSLPGFELLQKLQKLGCDVNWLLDDDDSKLKVDISAKEKKLEAEVKQLRLKLASLLGAMEKMNKVKQQVTEDP